MKEEKELKGEAQKAFEEFDGLMKQVGGYAVNADKMDLPSLRHKQEQTWKENAPLLVPLMVWFRSALQAKTQTPSQEAEKRLLLAATSLVINELTIRKLVRKAVEGN